MADLKWPESLCPASFSLYCDANVRGFSGIVPEPDTDLLEDQWLATITVDALNGTQMRALEVLKNRLAGGLNSVQLYHFARPFPTGSARTSIGLLQTAGLGEDRVTVSVAPYDTLKAGDMLKVGPLLLQVAEDCVADASGTLEVPLVNRIRKQLLGPARASTGWQRNELNVLESVASNVLRTKYASYYCNAFLNSDDLSAAAWVRINSVVVAGSQAVGGITTATRLASGTGGSLNDFLQQAVRYVSGTQVTATVRLLAGDATQSRIMARNAVTSVDYVLNWVGGVPVPAGVGAGVTVTVTSAGAGWHDVTTTWTTGEDSQNFRVYPDTGYTQKNIYAWRASLFRGAAVQTHVVSGGTQSAMGWGAVSVAIPLLEAAATNQVLRSQDLTAAGWYGPASATLSSYTYGGSVPFYTVAKTLSSTSERREYGAISGLTVGVPATATMALLAGTSSAVSFGLYNNGSWGSAAGVSIAILEGPGTISTVNGALTQVTGLSAIEPTVVRLTRIFAVNVVSVGLYIYPGLHTNTTIGASVLITAVQVESGTGTSYIPTAGTAVTRAADTTSAVVFDKPSVSFLATTISENSFTMGGLESSSLILQENI